MLQSILFATDFDPASEEAIRVGSYLARAFHSRISVLHVRLAKSLRKLGYADEAESYERRANELKGHDSTQIK